MDESRFDAITREMAAGAPRRAVLKGVAAGLAALVGARASAAAAGGDGGGRGRRPCCPSGYTALCTIAGRPTCTNTTSDPDNCGACGTVCPSGVCTAGVCSGGGGCPSGTTDCNGVCVDLSTDESNCGTCGTPCGSGETCVAGLCTGSVVSVCGDGICDFAAGEDCSTCPEDCGPCPA